MNVLNKNESAIFISLMCSLLPKDLHSEHILLLSTHEVLDVYLHIKVKRFFFYGSAVYYYFHIIPPDPNILLLLHIHASSVSSVFRLYN